MYLYESMSWDLNTNIRYHDTPNEVARAGNTLCGKRNISKEKLFL